MEPPRKARSTQPQDPPQDPTSWVRGKTAEGTQHPTQRPPQDPSSWVRGKTAEGTLGNWCAKARAGRGGGNAELTQDERAELAQLRKDVVELRMQRDVFKRSVALWVDEAMGR